MLAGGGIEVPCAVALNSRENYPPKGVSLLILASQLGGSKAARCPCGAVRGRSVQFLLCRCASTPPLLGKGRRSVAAREVCRSMRRALP